MTRVSDKISEMLRNTSLDSWVKAIVQDCTNSSSTYAQVMNGECELKYKVEEIKQRYQELTGHTLCEAIINMFEYYVPISQKVLEYLYDIQICNKGLEVIKHYWLGRNKEL